MEENNHVHDARARGFVAALRSFEQDGNPAGLVECFAPGATATRLDGRGERTDLTGFWSEYREPFDRVRTTFRNAVETDGAAVLEWDSAAVLTGGTEVTVPGVTVLDLGEDGVTALRTYYDTAAFVPGPPARV